MCYGKIGDFCVLFEIICIRHKYIEYIQLHTNRYTIQTFGRGCRSARVTMGLHGTHKGKGGSRQGGPGGARKGGRQGAPPASADHPPNEDDRQLQQCVQSMPTPFVLILIVIVIVCRC